MPHYMKNCPHCGKANDLSAFYCEACGQIIEKPANSDLYTVNQREEMYGVTRRSQDAISTTPNYHETPVYTTPAAYSPYGSGEAYAPSPYTQQSAGMQTPYYATPLYPQVPIEQGRSTGGIILSIMLYLFNSCWASLGVFGFLTGFTSNDISIVALLVFFLVAIVTLAFIMIKHKKPRLKWWVRLLVFLGITIIGFIVLIIAEGLSTVVPAANPGQVEDIYLGGTLVVFGILAMIASVL
ncbi:hypothetical protein KSB_38220 [Ktedonobacter robiniae]|uniref:Zinc-ribbon domain-containing protein n=2 Tax=Ktedonobacter robiniae TaxID=2778365 RepID=A0ABQ3USI9_9CHLR|nr:hypothetical protein KSB_38220 [Ktedonobacter robiniae]